MISNYRVRTQYFWTTLYNRDKHGRRVYIYRSGVWDPDNVTFEQGFATGYKILEMVSLEPKTQVRCISR